jgi:S-adenosylmethionine/arginine decarboxylase-like enzyme
MLVHHHFIYQAQVDREDLNQDAEKKLIQHLHDIVELIQMHILIEPQVAFSHQLAWTGFVGIITSHVSFHYWTKEKYLQLDVYSCKSFDKNLLQEFLTNYWNASEIKSLFINRESGREFKIEINP